MYRESATRSETVRDHGPKFGQTRCKIHAISMATYSGISHRVRKHGTRDKESRDSILVKPFGNPSMYYTPEKVPGRDTTEKRV